VFFAKYYLQRKSKKTPLVNQNDTMDERYNAEKMVKQLELDELLDKVSEKGLDSLNQEERELLENYSRNK
jgi:hypothetical protein